jgi:glycosyltransferase involved in cell wall biosynthesis
MPDKTKKVLIFASLYYPDFVGGAEVAIKEITDRIPFEEVSFDMVTLRMNSDLHKSEQIGNIGVYRVGWAKKGIQAGRDIPWYININKYFFLLTGLFKAYRLHKKNKYDCIWSMMASYNSFTAVLFKILFPKIRFVLTLQEGDPISYIKRRALPLYPLFKMIFTKADYIQTISEYLAKWAREMGAKCKIEVIPNGVSIDRFAIDIPLAEKISIRKSIGFDKDDIVMITTSRLVIKNAINDIISSLQYLDTKYKLLIIGSGTEEQNLKSLTRRLGLQDRVVFYGFLRHEDLPKYLVSSQLFVRPSLSEGLGISFLEAMACKIPIIGTPVGGIVEFLFDGETGMFAEIKNPKSIADRVMKIMRMSEVREKIVQNAFDLIKEKYDWNNISEKIKTIF